MKVALKNLGWRIGVPCLCLTILAIPSAAATIVTDNLSISSSGTDAVSGNLLLAADFSTGSGSYTLDSATLLLQMTSSGSAALDVYSDNFGVPGTLLGVLVSPASYSSALANATFTSSGVTLAANTTYWLVLQAATGAFQWSWTAANSGNGVGYTGDSAYFDGSFWYGSTAYPYQLSVAADLVGASAAPEPASILLILAGAVAMIFHGKQMIAGNIKRTGTEK